MQLFVQLLTWQLPHEALGTEIEALNANSVIDMRWVATKLNYVIIGLFVVNRHDSVSKLILKLVCLHLQF